MIDDWPPRNKSFGQKFNHNRFLNPKSSYERILMAPPCRFIFCSRKCPTLVGILSRLCWGPKVSLVNEPQQRVVHNNPRQLEPFCIFSWQSRIASIMCCRLKPEIIFQKPGFDNNSTRDVTLRLKIIVILARYEMGVDSCVISYLSIIKRILSSFLCWGPKVSLVNEPQQRQELNQQDVRNHQWCICWRNWWWFPAKDNNERVLLRASFLQSDSRLVLINKEDEQEASRQSCWN
jgi:hypothetical protein